jgi:hypothetical protein
MPCHHQALHQKEFTLFVVSEPLAIELRFPGLLQNLKGTVPKEIAAMPTLSNWNDEIQYTVPDNRYKTPTQVSEVQDIVRKHLNRINE